MFKIFNWDSKTKVASCAIKYKNQMFTSYAKCHPDDLDFESEKTGCCIAEYRAEIKCLQYIKNCEVKPAMEALNHVICGMRSSKFYNAKSYEARCIQKEYHRLQKQLTAINNEIAALKKSVQSYIESKDEFYNKIRKAKTK